jgi:hypothetical protein
VLTTWEISVEFEKDGKDGDGLGKEASVATTAVSGREA